MFSRLELARGDNGGSVDDGRIEVHEVFGIPIVASLVFLSGCETGVGRAWSTDFAPGEDYATLSRAFLYAGARNVISTLWAVEDEGAAAFARQFYTRLPSETPVAALAGAQRAMIASVEFTAPYHWAGYRLAGDGSHSR
jgi:CHAT domain-containing protein